MGNWVRTLHDVRLRTQKHTLRVVITNMWKSVIKSLISVRLKLNLTLINFKSFVIDRNYNFETMTYDVLAQAAMATLPRVTQRTCIKIQV